MILDAAVGEGPVGAHGAFWRTLTLEQFLVKTVYGLRVVVAGSPQESNLIKALEGTAPFGMDTGTAGAAFRRMPAGLTAVPPVDIGFIREWIQAGCPDDDVVEDVPGDSDLLAKLQR